MWTAFVLLSIASSIKLSQSIESFRPQVAEYCIKYDAGLGVSIYHIPDSWLLTYAALQLPFAVTNESKRQNTIELVAIIFGLLVAWHRQLHDFHYSLHGISISFLAWARVHNLADIIFWPTTNLANVMSWPKTMCVLVQTTIKMVYDWRGTICIFGPTHFDRKAVLASTYFWPPICIFGQTQFGRYHISAKLKFGQCQVLAKDNHQCGI
jgi:hypothetical protein